MDGRKTRIKSIPQGLYAGSVSLYNNIAPEPLYLFINEHPTASARCRSGSLEAQTAITRNLHYVSRPVALLRTAHWSASEPHEGEETPVP